MAPNHESGDVNLHQLFPPIDQIQVHQSMNDDVSQLTGDPIQVPASIQSPIGPADHGIPKTPERRVIDRISNECFEEGYDSDGQRAPWEGIEEEEYGEEEAIGDVEGDCDCIHPTLLPPDASPNPTILTIDSVMQMKVKELKDELLKRGISVRGKKVELQERLKEAVVSGAPLVSDMNIETVQNLAGGVFDTGAR